jgi:hypothetical protein
LSFVLLGFGDGAHVLDADEEVVGVVRVDHLDDVGGAEADSSTALRTPPRRWASPNAISTSVPPRKSVP